MSLTSGPEASASLRQFLRTCDQDRLPIPIVRQTLDLPPPPYSEFLSPECWLAGGSVLKWLTKREAFGRVFQGDYDFYFPGPRALDTTARAMMARGFELRGYRAFSLTLQEYFRKGSNGDRTSGLWDEAGRMAPITDELIQRLRLAHLELRSPRGDVLQLVAFFNPSPPATIARFDLSVCQLAVDHQSLSLGSWTAKDILNHRLRTVSLRMPDSTIPRLIKYSRRGFRPTLPAILSVGYRFAVLVLKRGPRMLFASVRRRPVRPPAEGWVRP